jgi:hypothetical protein
MKTKKWQIEAARAIAEERIEHAHYIRTSGDVFNALAIALPGEVVVLVGPSRVGKSRLLVEALRALLGIQANEDESHFVLVDAENAGKDGSFSTKDFMRSACEAIRHPIYGVAGEDDPDGMKLAARIERTSEGMLRGAFCKFVILKGIRYICFDEGHHVEYILGGDKNAAKVLDSWKCLAHKTRSVLVLVGSYKLLNLLLLAPHLLGRQRPIEFPRYREDSVDDLCSFEVVLETFGKHLRFEGDSKGLREWNQLLFTHSLGCVGHLSLWLRSALARMASRGIEFVTREVLLQTRMPARQEAQIAAEIIQGEEEIALFSDDEHSTKNALQPTPEAKKPAKRKGRPFQAKPARHKAGGRA